MFTYPARLDQLYKMLEVINSASQECSLDPVACSAVELAAEEVLVNIIYYAYPQGAEGLIEIEWQQRQQPAGLTLTVSDYGIPYNPLEHCRQCISSCEFTVGGYGIYYIVTLMDEVFYERDGRRNRLCLHKNAPFSTSHDRLSV